MRAEIEEAFDMHAVDIYGLSEVMGPGVANECVETKDGLHIWEDHFYPEVIDPETGEVLPDGERGELVFTSLTKEAFPVIRYRTRDLTRLLPGTARTMRRMEKVTGRSDDMMILRGVNVFPTQIEEQILAVEGLAPHFQIELTRDRAHGRDDGACRGPCRARGRRRSRGQLGRARRPHQGCGRVDGAHQRHRARPGRAQPGQGGANPRQAAEGRLMSRSRARDYDDKREAILHRAAIVFSRDGYDRASMARLAAECGVSKALLYHYCASKEALLFGIVENHLQGLVEAVGEADDGALSPAERLHRLVAALLDAYRDADAEHRVQIEGMRLLPEAEQRTLKALERRLVAIFADAVGALKPDTLAGGPLLKPVTMSLFGMLNWFYMWHREDGPLSRDDYAKLATQLLVGGVRGLS